jgi:hypothetical protein
MSEVHPTIWELQYNMWNMTPHTHQYGRKIVATLPPSMNIGPWLWKEENNKEEKVKSELHGRHSDCHWVEVRKKEEKMEKSMKMQVVV